MKCELKSNKSTIFKKSRLNSVSHKKDKKSSLDQESIFIFKKLYPKDK